MIPEDPDDRIELRGLRVMARHGVLAEELQRPQPFEIDLDLHLDLGPAGRSDSLADTVDYGAITDTVVAVMAGPPVGLMERLAQQIAEAVISAQAGAPVTAARVSVRKLRPPVAHHLATAGVTVMRSAGAS